MFSSDRFEGGGEVQEVVPLAPPTELELRAREQELKARYEDPRRAVEAKKAWDARREMRSQEKERAEKLKALLESSQQDSVSYVESSTKPLVEETARLSSQLAEVSAKEESVRQEQSKRGWLQKLKYTLVEDPSISELAALAKTKEEYELALKANTEKTDAVKSEAEARLAQTQENLADKEKEGKELYGKSKKRLLEQTRTVNRNSREAIRDTFLSMEKGELDIGKLAKESNAIVVHTIPLDGWHMGSTAMNNKEAATDKLSAKEKTDIILEKQPDLSASVLNVETREGQDMFYPFGYILDGKLIASYGQDEGTIASGDARRRKEEFHGTLQKDVKGEFARVAISEAVRRASTQHNESIVHKPEIKGILLDEEAIQNGASYFPGDEVREVFASKEEEERKMAEYKKRYGDSIISSSEEIRKDLGMEPKTLFVTRKRSGLEKAIEYAQQSQPNVPIYLRKQGGVYTLDGKKVTAEDIYA